MVMAKKFLYIKPFDGLPKKSNFKVVEEELPPLKDGEFLAEAVYLSVDPHMRIYADVLILGETMIGEQVAKILESKSSKFPVGKYVSGYFGWRTHTVVHEDFISPTGWGDPTIITYEKEAPISLALGTLGMPGNTAYFSFLFGLKPKAGQVLVISGAAGAVGHHVGQIAKLKGLTVIGIAGSNKKNEWLKSLGFDHVINYKTQNIAQALDEAAPQGVDLYYDNVGGEISSTVIKKMNFFGRIGVCGAISIYNSDKEPVASIPLAPLMGKQMTIKGLTIQVWKDRYDEAVRQNLEWIKEGKLKYKETITEGFDNMVEAFVGVLTGENIGKAVVKV